MQNLFTGKKFRFLKRDANGNVVSQWTTPGIDLKVKVVCKSCNEGWMSELEQCHAKPSLSDLILGSEIRFSRGRARSLAIFAFKTAVLVDRMSPGDPFFAPEVCQDFSKTLEIPAFVRMWMAGYLPIATGQVSGNYLSGNPTRKKSLDLFVCTYAVGHFAFQVVAGYVTGISRFRPKPGFESASIPFWPNLPRNMTWPPHEVLNDRQEFESFSARWNAVRIT